MATATHTEARFNDDDAAREHLESIRWPNGPVCPHCGGTERNSRLNGTSHRAGLIFCGDCREQFTVTVGTVFERSKVALHKWVYASHLMAASKKGISAKQLERMLGVTYKTAWFMAHRLREAMNIAPTGQMGGSGAPVEVDETYWGNSGWKMPGARGSAHCTKQHRAPRDAKRFKGWRENFENARQGQERSHLPHIGRRNSIDDD